VFVRLFAALRFVADNNPLMDYRQGMNVIAGTLLYNMPEPDAFFCFDALVMQSCPLYWLPTLEGAHAACTVRIA
jgi:hypothetical protein